ncbi:hypothetical protein BU26DRAFT_566452 [Trematosphaeria pertusa]|uniref:Uncharacterized protein n=1 Tax=Trematosphaeria pertusa TaxID=390896 RepID=A0A6A6IAP0_9PLEO|nr:uncharacterized protein BU26DRAFT_566452 [Trematosphaeria pertusa]KAF2247476.1 hypothetical protein BU26DRAFT_566452 [Trematosphaeria pertusa]
MVAHSQRPTTISSKPRKITKPKPKTSKPKPLKSKSTPNLTDSSSAHLTRLFPPPTLTSPGAITDAGFGVGKAAGETEPFPPFVDERMDVGVGAEHHCMACCEHALCEEMRRTYESRARTYGSRRIVVECRTYETCRRVRRRRLGLRRLW